MTMRSGLAAALLLTMLVGAVGNAATPRPRIGMVAYAGSEPTPRTPDGLTLVGFLRAERALPIRGHIAYMAPPQGPAPVLKSFGRSGYDMVFAPALEARAVNTVARGFRGVRFVVIDWQLGRLFPARHARNVYPAVFRAEQAGYLAGYLAASMAAREGRRMISAVAGFRFYGVTRWLVGYRAGAKKAVPRIAVRIDYSQDFANPAKCRRVALSQIAAGSRVVFNVAGACGLGALRAAREKGVWGVGVDVDQSHLGPHILTSAVMRLDRGVFDTVRKFVRGKLEPGTTVYGVRNGGVELGRISPKVPKWILRKVEDIRRRIADGTIRVPRPRG